MQLKRFFLFFFLLEAVLLHSQIPSDTVNFSIDARLNAGKGLIAPFLSTANQYDRHSLTPNSLSIWGTLHKDFDERAKFDYAFGMEMDANISKSEKRLFPGELYVQGKAYFFNAFVGMKREVFGNQDPELSSGGLIWSQNSRPMPKIAIESNGYLDVPFTKGYVEVKGGLSHGWFTDNTVTKNTLLHHKYAYIRFGGSFPVNLNYGMQHVCQWGGTSPQFGKSPATLGNFKRIFFGGSGNSSSPETEQINALGNHIISKNLGLDLNLNSVKVALYWQDIFEDGPVLRMNQAYNYADGLWGFSLRLPKFKLINSFLMEYMSTTDQSGPWHDLDGAIYGGNDNYYNNGVYPNGWSFQGMAIGNPWITSPKYNKNGEISFTNNKVRLYYFAGTGSISNLSYKGMLSYSENFGSPAYTFRYRKRQLSYQLETSMPLSFMKNTNISLGFSGDYGSMYGHNNFAVLLGIRYTGLFTY
jgi:Capsule assembly protein Wzi